MSHVLQSNKNKTYRGRWDRLSVSIAKRLIAYFQLYCLKFSWMAWTWIDKVGFDEKLFAQILRYDENVSLWTFFPWLVNSLLLQKDSVDLLYLKGFRNLWMVWTWINKIFLLKSSLNISCIEMKMDLHEFFACDLTISWNSQKTQCINCTCMALIYHEQPEHVLIKLVLL